MPLVILGDRNASLSPLRTTLGCAAVKKRRERAGEAHMPKIKVNPYQITRRLPAADGEFQYAIKSTYEDHERVARESELTRG